MVAFTDIGLAWNGLIPNDQSMSKKQVLGQTPVIVSINMPNTEGIAIGYGLGMRMALSGYQLRVDAAWNKEGIKRPLIYFSIGTDF
jgi:outer membrane protein assembly factor BamA